MAEEKPKCQAHVRSASGWHTYQCARTGTREHNGKRYCAQHHPDAERARLLARHAKWDQEQAIRRATHDLEYDTKQLVAATLRVPRDTLRRISWTLNVHATRVRAARARLDKLLAEKETTR